MRMKHAGNTFLLKLLVVCGLLLFSTRFGYSQDGLDSTLAHRAYPFRINAGVGAALYFGDIRTFDYQPVFSPYSELQAVYGISLERNLHPLWFINLGYTGGKLAGVQKYFSDGEAANLRFAGDFHEMSLSLGLNISELFYGKNEFRRLLLEASAGIGFMAYRSRLWNYASGVLVDSEGYDASGSAKGAYPTALVIPAGLRLRYALNQKTAVLLEAGYSLVLTDRLDAKERNENYDGFFSTRAGISYTFNRNKKKQRKIAPEKELVNQIIVTTDTFGKDSTQAPIPDPKPVVQKIMEISAIPETTPVRTPEPEKENQELRKEKKPAKERKKGKSDDLALVPEETKDAGYGFLPLVPQLPPDEIKEETPPGLEYRVQIMSTYMRRIPLNDLVLKYQLTQTVKEYYNNGWYQYTAGSFKTQTEASRYKEQLAIENGISDAFVVIFKDGNRFYQGKRKSMSFSVVGEENVRFPKPEIEENLSFDNVEFRVQVAAFTDRKVAPEKIRDRLRLEDKVRLDSNKNRYYYTVGSFSNLRQAREYCKLIISRNFVYDAFVIAYVDGVRKTLSEITTKVSPEGEKKVETKPGILFKVQLIALKDKQLSTRNFKEQYSVKDPVEMEERNGFHVYSSGNFKTYEDAMTHQSKMRQSGFPDAFIVAYRAGKRISLKEALIEF